MKTEWILGAGLSLGFCRGPEDIRRGAHRASHQSSCDRQIAKEKKSRHDPLRGLAKQVAAEDLGIRHSSALLFAKTAYDTRRHVAARAGVCKT